MLGRYAFSIVVGIAITLSLLFIMHLLIEHAEDAISKERTRHQLDFVRVKRNETLNVDDYTPEKPPPHRSCRQRYRLRIWTASTRMRRPSILRRHRWQRM